MSGTKCTHCGGDGKNKTPYYLNCELGGTCEEESKEYCDNCLKRVSTCLYCNGTGIASKNTK
jgi:hypothetical protein